ncbi:hypothetical protein B0J13DRAFT_558675 [Dactylonectria estremocensis]|uniref:Uncharacterized protein n=1 Tax=Dactylonectria estremocensis TaxID=1079267 RepID=A0A9P9EMR2_9HYPO|nr:hypothetical protein B0J13DRAFT_558675 [Dactylonectria estremocensis]
MPSLFDPPPPGIYDYTEIITFDFADPSVPSSLSDEATDVGKVWALTLRTYLEIEQTGIIWWALVHGAPHKAKLFIDWKTADGRQKYEARPESEHLRSAWAAVTSSPFQAALYHFPHDSVARQAGLCSTNNTVSVLFTFNFNNRPGSIEDAGNWDATFVEFVRAIMKSPGGVVATSSSYGWELNHNSYCAAFRYLNIETMQSFLEEPETRRLLEGLQVLAQGGVEIEYLETRVFSHGWQGSVDNTTPENPGTAAFITDAQRMFQGIHSSVVRGE